MEGLGRWCYEGRKHLMATKAEVLGGGRVGREMEMAKCRESEERAQEGGMWSRCSREDWELL